MWDYTEKSLPLKITAYLASFLFLYILLPVYLTKDKGRCSLALLFAFYLVNALIIIFVLKKNSDRKFRLEYRIQNLEEKFNILNEQNRQELKNQAALQAKIMRYDSLKKIVEEVNENLNLDSIADHLSSIAFSLISDNKGVCNLYLVDSQTQKLSLFKTKKEDKKLIIRTKEGDIFDLWVLRHTSPLLIEDIKKDFRFDLEKLKFQDLRPVSSLISAPFITEHRLLGILRLDNPHPHLFSQYDLRFLVKICDLGAVALENSELFQKTRDLAIHDGLTSLYTKGYFLERLKEECKRGIRQHSVFSLLMLDIDFFKNYNDRFGHTAGDIVLKNLSRNIIESLTGLDPIVSRFGGEEFCIILEKVDKKKAYSLACALRERIEKDKIILRRQETNITVSIGIAAFPLDAGDEEELIQKADKAMYEAKLKGRNQVCCI
jgi:diguanylate cyclase (GGDEF)-like protein